MRRTPKLRKMTSQWVTEKVTWIVLSSLAWKMVVIRQMDKLVTLARKRWKRRTLFTSCLLDFDEGCISFSVNGELMIDNQGQELAFSEIGQEGLVPVAYFTEGQKAELNLGVDVASFRIVYISFHEKASC